MPDNQGQTADLISGYDFRANSKGIRCNMLLPKVTSSA